MHIEVATARLLDLIREFDALGGWAQAGAKTCAEWLSWRVGLELRAGYERVRVARALPKLPLISAAFARAEISYSKVRALTRVATPQTEERLLTFARNGTAAHVETLARAWRRSIATPRTGRRSSSTGAGRSASIKTSTACSSSVAGSVPRWGRWSARPSRRRPTGCTPRVG